MKTFKQLMEEGPTNVTGPHIAGKDQPFFNKNKKFMDCEVFDVCNSDFSKSRFPKRKFERMKRKLDDITTGVGKAIHDFSKKNPKKGIIVKNTHGAMMFLKKPVKG